MFPVCCVCLCACCVCRTLWVFGACCVCLLCAVCGSCCASQRHAAPHHLIYSFISHRNSLHGCVYGIRYNFVSFSSLFVYPGADYTVPLAFPFYYVHGNPNLSMLRAIFYFLFSVFCVPAVCPVCSLCAVRSMCLLCVPYALGVWCVLCLFTVRCVWVLLCITVSRSPAPALPLFHTQKLPPRMRIRYPGTMFRLVFVPFLVPQG